MKLSRVEEGSVILLFPGEWHSYRPDPQTVWEEYWIGFRGRQADIIMQSQFFGKETPILNIGISYSVTSLFAECISYMHNEVAGYRFAAAGLVPHLLGHIYMKSRSREIPSGYTETLISRAKTIMTTSARHGMRPEDIARELGVGYSRFRQAFRKATGLSPAQYILQALIGKSKGLLAGDLPISEIAYSLGFENPAQFSALFRKKEGISPQAYRKSTFR